MQMCRNDVIWIHRRASVRVCYQRLIAPTAKAIRCNVHGGAALGVGFYVVCGSIQLTEAISHADEWSTA